MYIKDLHYSVSFSSFAESHFCKAFYKKYPGKQWIETRKTIIATLERAHGFQRTNLIDALRFSQEYEEGIFKLDFKIAGTHESPKSSGNRVIFHLANAAGVTNILLVYSKDHCPNGQTETQWISDHVKANFPECRKFF